MKNSELRNLAKEKMKGKFGKSVLYVMLYMLIVSLLNCTPAGVVFGIPLGFGIAKMLTLYVDGKKVKAFDFFNHGMDNFGNAWCTYLLLILKCLGPEIILLSGLILGVISKTSTLLIISNILFITGLILSLYIVLKYSLINYEIIYNSNLKARELMRKCAKDSKGNKWKIARMYIYYYLWVYLSMIFFIIITSLISKLIQSELLEVLLVFITVIMSCIISIMIQPQMIVALNELYKDITKESLEVENINI